MNKKGVCTRVNESYIIYYIYTSKYRIDINIYKEIDSRTGGKRNDDVACFRFLTLLVFIF